VARGVGQKKGEERGSQRREPENKKNVRLENDCLMTKYFRCGEPRPKEEERIGEYSGGGKGRNVCVIKISSLKLRGYRRREN